MVSAFRIGLGSLIVANLPHTEKPVTAESFMDQRELLATRTHLRDDDQALRDNQDALARQDLDRQAAAAYP